jgi:hypothetical protein
MKIVLPRDTKYYVSGIEIMTTRFSDYGFRENKEWREERDSIGCIYGTPKTISSRVNDGVPMFVIEMNNNRNKIEGVGFIVNRPCEENYKRRIHGDYNLNRYIYEGSYRLDKGQITDEYDKNVIWVLEMLLFKGSKHSKRSIGITKLPDWLKYNRFEYNFGEALWKMFVKYTDIERHEKLEKREIYEK